MKTKKHNTILLAVILTTILSSSSQAHAYDFFGAKKFLKNASEAVADTINNATVYIDTKNKEAQKQAEEQAEWNRQNRLENAETNNQANVQVVERKKATEALTTNISNSIMVLKVKVPEDSQWVLIKITKDAYTSSETYPVTDALFEKILPLKAGAGVYKIAVFVNKTTNRYTSYTQVKVLDVVNTDTRDLSYLLPSEKVQSTDPKIIELAKSLTENTTSESEAILEIHNYVINTVKYDFEAFESGTYVNKPFDAISVLNSSETFCSGYSNFFAALARAAGIRARVVQGNIMRDGKKLGHAWNEVYINNEWKIIDTTWDTGRTDHKYFLPKAEVFAEDHFDGKVMDIY
jgi:transglutaminase/protease-like cytokinesis protein 3